MDERRVVVKEPSNEVKTRGVASAFQANKLKILELEAAEMLLFGGPTGGLISETICREFS